MPRPDPRPTEVSVLGLRFHNLTRSEVAAAIARLAKGNEKSYVVKPYSEFLPRAARDPEVRAVLDGAALCLPDGAGIIWAAHFLSLPGGTLRALVQFPLSLASLLLRPAALRRPLREPMSGVDLTWQMLEALAAVDASVFLLGGREEEAEGARRAIEQRLPALRVAGAHHGYFSTRGPENDAVVRQINAVRPDALLVGMGFPRQEKWIAANLPALDVKVAVGEGGSFSFISGLTPRAPRWMRRSGLEWLYRLLRQPARIRRQLQLPVFVWLVLRERLTR